MSFKVADSIIKTGSQSISSIKSFDRTVSGLNPNTTYEYRAVAENSAGTESGEIKSFAAESEGSIILEFDDNQKEVKVLEDGRIEIIN